MKSYKIAFLVGKIIPDPPRPEVRDDLAKAKIEDFSRLTYGESFIVSGAPTGNHQL